MAPPTPTPAAPRLLKALAVSALAVAAAHLVLSDTLRLSFSGQAAATLGAPPGYSADQAFTTALINTFLTLPFVLWAGMRISGEKRVGAMVLVGTVAWILALDDGVDRLDDAPGTLLPLPALALVVGATALASLIRRRSPAP